MDSFANEDQYMQWDVYVGQQRFTSLKKAFNVLIRNIQVQHQIKTIIDTSLNFRFADFFKLYKKETCESLLIAHCGVSWYIVRQ